MSAPHDPPPDSTPSPEPVQAQSQPEAAPTQEIPASGAPVAPDQIPGQPPGQPLPPYSGAYALAQPRARFTDRLWSLRSMLAVAAASVILGGAGGAGIVALADHGDQGGRAGFGPGRGFGGPGQGFRGRQFNPGQQAPGQNGQTNPGQGAPSTAPSPGSS